MIYDMIRYGMVVIDCNWVSSRWQCSVDLWKNRKQTEPKEKTTHKTIQKHRIHKIENKNTKQKINRKE